MREEDDIMAGQTLEHTGAAIVEEYYPPYATEVAPTYPLYSTSIYVGSVILLLSMSMLGLPITAIGYYTENAGVSLGLVIAAVSWAGWGLGLALASRRGRRSSRAGAPA